jgi:hypothetical protein
VFPDGLSGPSHSPGSGRGGPISGVTGLDAAWTISASSRRPSSAARRFSSYPPDALQGARGHLFLDALALCLSDAGLPGLPS